MSFEGDPGQYISGPELPDFSQNVPEELGDTPPLPDHETLLINDQAADGSETIEPSPDSVASIAEEAPTPIEVLLAARAIQQAGYRAEQLAYVAEHSGNPETAEYVYKQAQNWEHRDKLNRIRVFAHRSTLPDGDEAWQRTLDAISATHVTYEKQELVHPAELIVPSQTDPERLQQIVAVADALQTDVIRAHILRGVASRQADTNDINAAMATIQHMADLPETHDSINEARVAVASYWARNNNGSQISDEAMQTLNELSPEMRAWGFVKLAAAHNNPEQSAGELWLYADIGLTEQWGGYNMRQRSAIIKDLQQAGQLGMAERFAYTLIPKDRGTAPDRELQTEIILGIAHAKEAHNTGDGLITLTRLEEHTADEIQWLTGSRARGTAPRWGDMAIEEDHGVLALVSAHRAALLVKTDPANALAMLREAPFPGKQHDQYEDRGLGIVARAFAEIGDVETAISLTQEIGWYPSTNKIKSEAYADIARITRERHHAETA
jgi:hypothetical protein